MKKKHKKKTKPQSRKVASLKRTNDYLIEENAKLTEKNDELVKFTCTQQEHIQKQFSLLEGIGEKLDVLISKIDKPTN